MNSVLVIIVTYNPMKWVERCFNSLRQSNTPVDIFVVDNGSTDGGPDYIQKKFPEVIFYQSKENLGFGKANNIGLQYAYDKGYDYIYLLNQDAWIFNDTIEQLTNISKRHPEYGILSPFQIEGNLSNLDYNFIYDVICNKQSVNTASIINDWYFCRKQDVYDVDFVMAAHWLITKKCLNIVGGFSPTFPHYGEDNNYADRVHYWKLKVGIVPSCKAVHDRGNREISNEKKLYLLKYIYVLRVTSNPNSKVKLGVYIRSYLKNYLRHHKLWMRKYAIRLYKERKIIKNNLEKSLEKHAFLQ